MKLSKQEIVKIIKNPKLKDDIEKGRRYESRLRLFTEAKFKEDIIKEPAWEEFRGFMKKVLSNEKDIRISEFIQYPLSSVNITESLMSDLYKVFDAGNSFFSVYTVKKNGGGKLQKYLRKINVNRWIEEQGKIVLKNKPNTIIVVDKNENGEPYLLPIENDRLIDVSFKEDNVTCEYVAFIHSIKENVDGSIEKRIAVYDDENYNVVLLKDGEYIFETRISHNARECPARMFLRDRLNSRSKFSRKSPLALVLSKLQEWQYFDIYKFYTDHYAPFPVTEMVRAKCGNENCINGTIYEEETYYVNDEARVRITTKPCNICEENNKIGVGAKILLDPPEEGVPSAAGKFRLISNDVSNLEYLQEKLNSIENYIKLKVVGVDNILSKEAVNEKQVKGSFESRTNVLLNIKSNLDEVYEWVVRTIANVTIGDKPLHINANFGTEWYLISEDELQKRFEKANKIGLPKEEVDMIYNQLIETKYKGNPDKIEKLKIINELNPCPYDDLDTKLIKYKNGLITKQEFIISERLIIFVNKFEELNGSIVEFGVELERQEKLKLIIEQIKTYADEYIKENETEQNNTEQIGNGEETD